MPNYRKLGLPKLTGNTGADIQNLRNAFYQQDEQLRYLFEHLDGGNFTDEFFSSINDGVARWKTDNRVEIDTAGLVSEVLSAADDAFTRFEQTVQGITLTVVDSEGNETSIKLSDGKLDMTGLVTFTDLSTQGKTTINGSNITTGTLNADLLKAGTINGIEYYSRDPHDPNSYLDMYSSMLHTRKIGTGNTGYPVYHDVYVRPGMISCEYGDIEQTQYIIDYEYDGIRMYGSEQEASRSDVKASITLDDYKYLKIRGRPKRGLWYEGRDNAILASNEVPSGDAYYPLIDIKTPNGDWSMGSLGIHDYMYFVYTKDNDYDTESNKTERYFIDPENGFIMSGATAVNRYYTASSTASGKSYSCGFGVGNGGVNRGIYDFTRGQWTLFNDDTDTVMRTTGAFYFFADTDASVVPYAIVLGHSSDRHPMLHSNVDDYGHIGGLNYRWNTLYTYNVDTKYAPNVSSDRRWKKDISYDLSSLDGIFDLLEPAVYRMKGDAKELLRFGFIAQDMAGALEKLGLNPDDYAVLQKDENGYYSIGYTETNALLWNEVQKLKSRIAELEKGVA